MFSSFSRPDLCELPARANLLNPLSLICEPEAASRYVLGEVRPGVYALRLPEMQSLPRLMGLRLPESPGPLVLQRLDQDSIDEAFRDVNQMLDRWNDEAAVHISAAERARRYSELTIG